MATLRVPGLNLQIPLEDFEAGSHLAEVALPAVEAATRDALTQWLGGMAEIAPETRWDGARWIGTLRYLGEAYPWQVQ
jgi:hypothetical protein